MPHVDDNDVATGATAGAAKSRFRAIALPTRIELEAAVLALRMIQGQRWHGRLLTRDGMRDDDVLTLVGLEFDDRSDKRLTCAELRETFDSQLKHLERRFGRRVDTLARNLCKLAPLLKLDAAEQAVLRMAVITSLVRNFTDLFSLTLTSLSDLQSALSDATQLPLKTISAALAPARSLRRSGFLEHIDKISQRGNPVAIDEAIYTSLLSPRFDESRFLRHLIRPAPPATLAMEDFAHVPEFDLAQRYLADASARRRRGVNLLAYGAPGTGKTEFARTLAGVLGLRLHEVPNENEHGFSISGSRRFRAYTVCQQLLAHQQRQLLLFDEVEDVFGSNDERSGFELLGVRGRDQDDLRKGWINETLESNPVPALWICNSIRGMDPAYLRRFDMIIEFRAPGRVVRRRMIDRYLRPTNISEGCAERLAGIEKLAPAHVARAARVARSLRGRDVATRDSEVERLVRSTLRAMGNTKPIASPTLPEHYDPSLLNADRSLEVITAGLKRRPAARMCLYGPPGTGKTAFAHHLGAALDRPVLMKHASDLLSMWVGGTEARIAAAFEQAGDEEAILVIDEADSFLRDRTGARQSWEVTQVNELLTQMEAFGGLFVASTNLVDSLDSAALRRFDFKVKFGFLTAAQRRAFLLKVACDADDPSATASPSRLDRLENLTPGDFANALRQLRVTGESPTAARIVDLLAAEASMKPETCRRPIGFVQP